MSGHPNSNKEVFDGAKAAMTGIGWYVWNYKINQSGDTHLSADYTAELSDNQVIQSIHSSDTLIVYQEG